MESPQRDSRIGVVLNGRYRITELLGEGGMGLVYRGERLQLGRPVAIKFLHSPYAKSPKYMARFEREARAMSKLSHPYCVSVIDFGVHDEPYIVMDFVTGETLRDLMDRERIAPARAIQITRQILAGLAHAHGQGVIHRDIKPGNVMVGEATGVGDHVRIFDFGLAKLHDPAVEGDHSMATVIGTPAYMAPEQTRAEAIDARADLYATGVLLFEMLTGNKPFVGEDAYAVIRMQRDQPPQALRELAPELSPELEQVVAKALEKDREQRYQTAAEFVAALDNVPEAFARPVTGAEGTADERARTTAPVLEAPVVPTADRTTTGAASGANPPGTRLAVLMLLLVAAVGAFAYVRTRSEAVQIVEAPRLRTRDLTPGGLDASSAAPPAATAAALPADAGGLDMVFALDDDAGALDGGSELSEAELAAADTALDDATEQEAKPVPRIVPEVRTVSDVHELIELGDVDAAIVGLQQLRRKSPQNPYLPYLIGDLYFGRGWWSDALAKYREAIKLSDGYRRRATIQRNAIEALGSDRSYARARVLLVRDVGRPVLPLLKKAASDHPSPLVRKRARQIAAQIAR